MSTFSIGSGGDYVSMSVAVYDGLKERHFVSLVSFSKIRRFFKIRRFIRRYSKDKFYTANRETLILLINRIPKKDLPLYIGIDNVYLIDNEGNFDPTLFNEGIAYRLRTHRKYE